MKRLILPVFCIIAVLFSACGQSGEKAAEPKNQDETYLNEKFRFEVTYPRNILIPQGETPNRFGQKFESEDKEAVLNIYGKFNSTDVPFEKAYDNAQNGRVTQKEIDEKQKMFRVSGVHSNIVYHIKTYLDDRVYMVYEFRYPEDQEDIYGPINEEIIESFKVLY